MCHSSTGKAISENPLIMSGAGVRSNSEKNISKNLAHSKLTECETATSPDKLHRTDSFEARASSQGGEISGASQKKSYHHRKLQDKSVNMSQPMPTKDEENNGTITNNNHTRKLL